jgi:excisionase family DNA binding protein
MRGAISILETVPGRQGREWPLNAIRRPWLNADGQGQVIGGDRMERPGIARRTSNMEQLITGREISEKLHVNLATVYRLISSGRMPRPIKLGGATRWRSVEIDAWISRGCPPLTKWHFEEKEK